MHPAATWGKTHGNPIWEEMSEVALVSSPTLLVYITKNSGGNITAVFAGEMTDTHAMGSKFVSENAMLSIPIPYDIVITTNGGYP